MRVLSSLLAIVFAALALPAPCVAGNDSPVATGKVAPGVDRRVVAYYFHGNFRCATCRTIEAYSEEAVTEGFVGEIGSGRLAWRVVNIDEPENKHFVQDFQLVSKSLVLVEYRDGKVGRFENLKLVWQLVGDKEAFLDYVRASTREFLHQG